MGFDMTSLFIWCFIWGVLSAIVANRKKNPLLGFLAGILLGPIGFLFSFFVTDKRRKCPECGGTIPDAVKRCKHCGVTLEKPEG